MKSTNETTFPYLLVSIALGIIAAILLVPRSGPDDAAVHPSGSPQ